MLINLDALAIDRQVFFIRLQLEVLLRICQYLRKDEASLQVLDGKDPVHYGKGPSFKVIDKASGLSVTPYVLQIYCCGSHNEPRSKHEEHLVAPLATDIDHGGQENDGCNSVQDGCE